MGNVWASYGYHTGIVWAPAFPIAVFTRTAQNEERAERFFVTAAAPQKQTNVCHSLLHPVVRDTSWTVGVNNTFGITRH